ncbi:MAG: type IV pilus assembly protein PilM [Planctomycetales bacterium]|nr:type IV pilus assembly protein PilM [Planctomycetales bacterium]
MAKALSVWGIEIGQSALKALRCRLDGEQVVAEAFDYIEYPKILSQPDTDAEVLIREALETFVKRNDLKKTRVAVSVPGQSGLAKFFKPPPVELKKLRDIVKYEAKQQIPFELDDVVWDYQLMLGSDISDGFALESEVGLFAMKRDAVHRALKPLQTADIEVDLLQLAPLSLYNMVTYDRSLVADEEARYDSEHPPKSTVVLAMGTDATDLIVTNGFRVWQRSMPLGGNHFTRQLSKELKLTYVKAEHLKRNAMEADDPKLVFQAMRPVFNDLVTEVQRSMGFFRSLNKKAEIGSLLMLGNSVKLPGLTQYLSKNLAMDVEVVDAFSRLTGDEVLNSPAFKDHAAAFGPVYGLCLQSLGLGPISTNLVPVEIAKERLIRSKKPWAVAASAALLMGFAGNLLPAAGRWAEIHPTKWDKATTAAESTKKSSDSMLSTHEDQKKKIDILQQIGAEVSGSGDRRLLWMEVWKAITDSLKRSPDIDLNKLPDPEEVPYNTRTDIHITKVDCKFYDDISKYLTGRVEQVYQADRKTRLDLLGLLEVPSDGEDSEDAAAADPLEAEATVDVAAIVPPNEGEEEGNAAWVIQIDAYHFHNGPEYASTGDEREEFVLKTWVNELEGGSVKLPMRAIGEDGVPQSDANGNPVYVEEEFTYKELGLLHPLVIPGNYLPDNTIPNPEYIKKYGGAGGGTGGYGGAGYGGEGGYGGAGYGGGEAGYGGAGYGGSDGGGYGGGYGSGSGGGAGMYGGTAAAKPGEEEIPRSFPAPKFPFKLQIIWKEKPLTLRLLARELAKEAAEAEGEGETEGDVDPTDTTLGDENLASDI